MVRYDYGWKNINAHKGKIFYTYRGAIWVVALPAGANPFRRGRSGRVTIQGKWWLLAVLPGDTAAGKVPEINFDVAAGNFTGNTGCNSMRGNFHLSDSSLVVDQRIITTKIMCVGYNEAAFLKNLIRVNGFKIQNGNLILMVDGNVVSRWSRKIMRPAKILSI